MTASLMTHGPLNEASFTSTELPSAHACKQTIKLQTDYMLVYIPATEELKSSVCTKLKSL